MYKYELGLVLSGKLEDEEKNAALQRVEDYIARFGGTITNVDDQGKKRLAYEIQHMKEGYYYYILFESNKNDCAQQVEANLRIMEPVIRFLIVNQPASAPAGQPASESDEAKEEE